MQVSGISLFCLSLPTACSATGGHTAQVVDKGRGAQRVMTRTVLTSATSSRRRPPANHALRCNPADQVLGIASGEATARAAASSTVAGNDFRIDLRQTC
jgi:hypothetical protein